MFRWKPKEKHMFGDPILGTQQMEAWVRGEERWVYGKREGLVEGGGKVWFGFVFLSQRFSLVLVWFLQRFGFVFQVSPSPPIYQPSVHFSVRVQETEKLNLGKGLGARESAAMRGGWLHEGNPWFVLSTLRYIVKKGGTLDTRPHRAILVHRKLIQVPGKES